MVPRGKLFPGALVLVTVTAELSVAVGSTHVATCAPSSPMSEMERSSGQSEMTGTVLSVLLVAGHGGKEGKD